MAATVTDKRRNGARLRYEQLLSERQSSATATAVSLGPNSRRQRDLDDERARADQEFLATQGELGDRPPNIKLENPVIFWISASIICVVEAMFNRVVVEMSAPIPGWAAFLIAGLVSAFLMFCAHLLGWLLRQVWSEINRSVYPMNVIVGLGLLAIDVLGVLGIVMLRVYFATVELGDTIDIFNTAGAVVGMGFDLLAKVPTDPEALVLGGVNVLALVIALVLGALSHDSERQYDTHYKALNATTEAARRAVDKYERRQEAVFRKYRSSLSRAIRGYVGNGGSIADLPKDDFKAQRYEAESVIATAAPTATVRPISSLSAKGTAA